MKFTMDDTEIRNSYNTAKNPAAQVQVLAELNAVPQAVMAEKLRELGCDVPVLQEVKQKPLRAKEVLFDENRARALFAEGKSDLEIAEMLGISVYAFATWRRKNGMKRPMGGAAPRKDRTAAKQKPCRSQPPIPPEVEIPELESSPETSGSGSQATVAAVETKISAGRLGQTLLDLEKRYPGLMLTVNGAAVRALCLNVRVMMGEDTTTSTLDLEVG